MNQRTLRSAGRTCAWLALAVASAAAGPATQPSTQSAAALLAQVDTAYAALTSAQFDGHVTAHFDVAGRREDHDAPFTSVFAAPNRFRHEVPGDALACSTGTRVYAALTGPNEYVTGDAPKVRTVAADWPANVGQLLSAQNPSLLLAMVPSASQQLARDTSATVELPPVSIDGVACPAARYDTTAGNDDGQSVTAAFDPATHLLRRVTFDLARVLAKHGATDVRAATITVDYTAVRTGVAVAADRFAYTPPSAAVLASAGPVAQGDAAGESADDGPAAGLVDKPAPAFTLESLDGSKVTLVDLKGKVVVLDMWATWCGPCVASLPHLDEMAKQYKAQSAAVAVFAVDQTASEPQGVDAVRAFVQRKGWTLPVLLDADGNVGKAYLANAIPETVVVGKDATVRKVFVGSGHEDDIRAAVDRELAR